MATVADVAVSTLLWSQFMARFGGNHAQDLAFQWVGFSFGHYTCFLHPPLESFFSRICLDVYKTQPHPHTPLKSKAFFFFSYHPCFLFIASSYITHTKHTLFLPWSSSPMAAAIAETQFHVLAVDDSLPDRKLIERLLKTSSFQGIDCWSYKAFPCNFSSFPWFGCYGIWHLIQKSDVLFLQSPLLILGPRLWSSWGSMVRTPQFLSMQTIW